MPKSFPFPTPCSLESLTFLLSCFRTTGLPSSSELFPKVLCFSQIQFLGLPRGVHTCQKHLSLPYAFKKPTITFTHALIRTLTAKTKTTLTCRKYVSEGMWSVEGKRLWPFTIVKIIKGFGICSQSCETTSAFNIFLTKGPSPCHESTVRDVQSSVPQHSVVQCLFWTLGPSSHNYH